MSTGSVEVKTYRAGSMREALDLVRRELGPDAAVLHTREVRGGMLGWMKRKPHIEITASPNVQIPSRLPQRILNRQSPTSVISEPPAPALPPAHLEQDYRAKFRHTVKDQQDDLNSMVELLCRRGAAPAQHDPPEAWFQVFTELIEADISEELARELIAEAQRGADGEDCLAPAAAKARVARLVESRMIENGPIRTTAGRRRLVALVGPTGVGKTTTIAKLAANFRLREKLRVGLITVDTYRIAAVEQLKTYADIIDLPMEVVATPREMRQAVARMDHLDLVLMDTAGRSPRDDVRIQELKSMLSEANPDEVHLVMSGVSGAGNLTMTANMFAQVGTTALIVTKLDEATGLGNLLALLSNLRLPISYLTNGQNVPDDITVADRKRLAAKMLGGVES